MHLISRGELSHSTPISPIAFDIFEPGARTICIPAAVAAFEHGVTTRSPPVENEHVHRPALLRLSHHPSLRVEVTGQPLRPAAAMATATQRAEDVDVIKGADEVSLSQKMLSAVSGSILTSLLGESISRVSRGNCAASTAPSVTVPAAACRWTLTDVHQSPPSMSSASACSRRKHHRKRLHSDHAVSMAPPSPSSATCPRTSASQRVVERSSG